MNKDLITHLQGKLNYWRNKQKEANIMIAEMEKALVESYK